MTDAELLISCLDLTDLSDGCEDRDVEELCAKAATHRTAAVCVWPRFVPTALGVLRGSMVKVATVINFPAGEADLDELLAETEAALTDGAHELDVVIPHRRLRVGEPGPVSRTLTAVVGACAGTPVVVKAILETGALCPTPPLVRIAANLAADAGVGFLKTSTGKIAEGADPGSVSVLLKVAGERGNLGVKISGGLRTVEAASGYLDLARAAFGADRLGPDLLRIGASSLLDELAAAAAGS